MQIQNYTYLFQINFMKHLTIFCIYTVLFTSCTIRFDRVPKNTLNQFPNELCSKYFFKNTKDNDSTYLEITQQTILFSENKSLRGGSLSDTIKIAKGKAYYYLCLGDTVKGKFVWDVYPLKRSGKKLYLFALDADYYKKSIKKFFTPIPGLDDYFEMNETKLDKFCAKKLKSKNALKLEIVE